MVVLCVFAVVLYYILVISFIFVVILCLFVILSVNFSTSVLLCRHLFFVLLCVFAFVLCVFVVCLSDCFVCFSCCWLCTEKYYVTSYSAEICPWLKPTKHDNRLFCFVEYSSYSKIPELTGVHTQTHTQCIYNRGSVCQWKGSWLGGGRLYSWWPLPVWVWFTTPSLMQ